MATGTPAHEFRELDNAELETRLKDAKEELFNLRFQKATGQLTNNRRIVDTTKPQSRWWHSMDTVRGGRACQSSRVRGPRPRRTW